MKDEARILYNAIRCPDGTILESPSDGDYSSHMDKKTGALYSVNGGMTSLGRKGPSDYEELSVIWTPGMPHDILREYLRHKGVPLCDLHSDRINSILDTNPKLDRFYAKAFIEELNFRGEELQ